MHLMAEEAVVIIMMIMKTTTQIIAMVTLALEIAQGEITSQTPGARARASPSTL
jgi:hypothetical protein